MGAYAALHRVVPALLPYLSPHKPLACHVADFRTGWPVMRLFFAPAPLLTAARQPEPAMAISCAWTVSQVEQGTPTFTNLQLSCTPAYVGLYCDTRPSPQVVVEAHFMMRTSTDADTGGHTLASVQLDLVLGDVFMPAAGPLVVNTAFSVNWADAAVPDAVLQVCFARARWTECCWSMAGRGGCSWWCFEHCWGMTASD